MSICVQNLELMECVDEVGGGAHERVAKKTVQHVGCTKTTVAQRPPDWESDWDPEGSSLEARCRSLCHSTLPADLLLHGRIDSGIIF